MPQPRTMRNITAGASVRRVPLPAKIYTPGHGIPPRVRADFAASASGEGRAPETQRLLSQETWKSLKKENDYVTRRKHYE
jgi:hypothetical protein